MTTVDAETARNQGYLEGRLEEQSKTLQDLKAGQQQIIHLIDRTNDQTNDRIDRLNDRIDRLNDRIDRMMLAGWVIGGAIITTQMGLVGTVILFAIRMSSGS